MKTTVSVSLIAVTAVAAFGLGWVARPDSQAGASGESQSNSSDGKTLGSGRSITSRDSAGGSAQNSESARFLSKYLVEGKISPSYMRSAIEELSKINDPIEKQKLFSALLENLTAENAKDAFVALRENSGGGRGPGGRGPGGRGNDDELRLLANAWGRIDGAGAMAALTEMSEAEGENGGRRDRGRRGGPEGLGREMVSVLSGWATVDGPAAASHIDSIEGEREKQFAAYGVVRGMLVNGVDEAVSFVTTLPSTGDGDRAKQMYTGMITSEILEQGLDSAKTWVDTLSDPEMKSGALSRVAMEMMAEDRSEAASWLATYSDDDAAAPAVNRLADSWSREDPQAVIEWADTLSGQAKAEAFEEAMESWGEDDPSAAGAYLQKMPESPARDAAIGGFASRVSREDPTAAMDWANSISDAELRQETIVDVARDWIREDRTAAEEWIGSSGLPEEAVKEITESRREGRGGRGR